MRKQYPGACSIEYQNIMSVVIECLLNWDVKKQTSKGPGVLGNVLAFARADEEQGRGSLHSHWQIWVEELSQKVRDMLFDGDKVKRQQARDEFYKYIDQVMCASYGSDLRVSHVCDMSNDTSDKPVPQPVDEIFESREPQILRDARHAGKCRGIAGKVMECKQCHHCVSAEDLLLSDIQQRYHEEMAPHISSRKVKVYCLFCYSPAIQVLNFIILFLCLFYESEEEKFFIQ
jgi:hypothetical protein